MIGLKLDSLTTRMEEREREIIGQLTSAIEAMSLNWEKNSKSTLIQDYKNQVVIEVAKHMKNVDLKFGVVDRDEVLKLIHAALKLYDSDKTGLADYALEPAGIISFCFYFYYSFLTNSSFNLVN